MTETKLKKFVQRYFHKCRTCKIKFPCEYNYRCSSYGKSFDCPNCYDLHVKGLVCLISSKKKIISGKIPVLRMELF